MKVRQTSVLVLPPPWLRIWTASAVFVPVCAVLLAVQGQIPGFTHLALYIHEAGHYLFAPFGDAAHAAGGSLMQILLPSGLVWHFWRHRIRLGVQVALLFLGQSYLDIGVYAADARRLALPLVMGRTHDWHYILADAGLLEYDVVIAAVFFVLAVLSFAALVVLPLYAVYEDA